MNSLKLDEFMDKMTEKFNEVSKRQTTHYEMSQNKFQNLEKKIQDTKVEIIQELKDAIRENADIRKTHEVMINEF